MFTKVHWPRIHLYMHLYIYRHLYIRMYTSTHVSYKYTYAHTLLHVLIYVEYFVLHTFSNHFHYVYIIKFIINFQTDLAILPILYKIDRICWFFAIIFSVSVKHFTSRFHTFKYVLLLILIIYSYAHYNFCYFFSKNCITFFNINYIVTFYYIHISIFSQKSCISSQYQNNCSSVYGNF